jgi:hypothetical protein
MTAVIETNELTKTYGKYNAVDHLTFELRQGEIFGFLGPNGAGKTTTILMLLGLTEPSSGSARVLGFDLGIARVVGAVVFAVVIGLIMAVIFRKDEQQRTAAAMQLPEPPPSKRKRWQTALLFVAMITFLVFSDWANPSHTIIETADGRTMHVVVLQKTKETWRVQFEEPLGDWKKGEKDDLAVGRIASHRDFTPEGYHWAAWLHHHRWYFAGACLLATLAMAFGWFEREELSDWMAQTWSFSKSIIPLLFGGVLVTGFVGALIPEEIVARWVGGEGLSANLVASMIGAMWYFATLTEIPILEALIGLGMGRGPALALLLAGPALSLPSVAVIYSVLGFRKTLVFCVLTVLMSTLVGMMYGWLFV